MGRKDHFHDGFHKSRFRDLTPEDHASAMEHPGLKHHLYGEGDRTGGADWGVRSDHPAGKKYHPKVDIRLKLD